MNSGLIRLAVLTAALASPATSRGEYLFFPAPNDNPPAVGWVEKEYFRQTAIQAQERYRFRLPVPSAAPENLSPADAAALPVGGPLKTGAPAPPQPPSGGGLERILLAALALMGGALAVRQFVLLKASEDCPLGVVCPPEEELTTS